MADPLSMGVVIGIGGSGIQTISRVRAAVRGDRPDAAATPAIQFVGIDAVDLSAQVPPLPPGVDLAPSEFVNLTSSRMFDAHAYVQAIIGGDGQLSHWWDAAYQVPVGPLTDGLKQSRMLGRLVFYREGAEITARIRAAMHQAMGVRETDMRGGTVGTDNPARLKVFVVSSTCGGTGSAGFLDVVHKIWVAATQLGVTPDIRAFLYLPGVFEYTINQTSHVKLLELENQKSNAFAFLRELDHFIEHADELDDEVANPGATPPAQVPAGQLLKQVYLIDATIEGAGRLSRITDSYEIAAEAIYQFLMTEAGRPQMAQNGTNTDLFLTMRDAHKKRRIYCGLGVAAVTYPGETFRRHLRARVADWLIRELLLADRPDLAAVVRSSEMTQQLLGELRGAYGAFANASVSEDEAEFRLLCESAPEALREDPSEGVVSRILTEFAAASPRVVRSIQETARPARDQALRRLDQVVLDVLSRTGQSAHFHAGMLAQAEKVFSGLASEVSERRAMHQRSAPELERDAHDLRVKYEVTAQRALRLPKAKEKAAETLGRAVQAWGAAVVGENHAAEELVFLRAAADRLEDLRQELERAQDQLGLLSRQAYRAWTADELIGKDAGPTDTTALIPGDAQPQVEACALLNTAFDETVKTLRRLDLEEAVRDLYSRWQTEGRCRGLFSLGSKEAEERELARQELIRQLDDLTDRHGLQRDVAERSADTGEQARFILPRSLRQAAERLPNGEQELSAALASLLRLSRRACWTVNVANLGDVDIQPSPSTVIVRPVSLSDHLDGLVGPGDGTSLVDSPDEERVVALSTEWGSSAHAVGPVAGWERAYRRQLQKSAEDESQPRPHLSRRWADSLDLLVPVYYDPAAVAQTVARALLVTDLLRADPQAAAALLGPAPVRGERPWPLAITDQGDSIEFVGTIWRPTADGPWRAGRTITLGSTYHELLTAVGHESEYRQMLEALTAAMLSQAGRPAAIAALDSISEKTVLPRLQLAGNETEIEALETLHAAVTDLRLRLQTAEASLKGTRAY